MVKATPTPESVLDAVRALLPTIRAAAATVDRSGEVRPEIIDALHDAGYFSLLKPPAFGGLDSGPQQYLTATRELSAACMSTGWLAGWLGVNSWGLSVREETVLQEIWGTDHRALLCSSYAPTGRLQRVDGGFRLSGRWTRCTGARQSSWLSAAALRLGSDGAAQDFMAVLVPRADYVVEPTWNGLGLRGIGADDVLVSGAFVPDHRTFSWLHSGRNATATPLDSLPQPTVFTLAGTMPLLGGAQRVLAAQSAATGSAPLSGIAMAHNDIKLSLLQIQRNVGELVECVSSGGQPDAELVLRTRRDQVMACERALKAVGAIVSDAHGSGDEELLERVWRDMQTARKHVSSNIDQVLAVAGRFALGLNVDDLIW